MLVKGYSFSEVYKNGAHHMNENAIKYDGHKLELFSNDDGIIEYQTIDNEDLLRFIGQDNKPLFKRLESDFKIKKHHKRHHKSRSNRHHKSHSKTKSHRKQNKMPKSARKYFRKYKSPHKNTLKRAHKSLTQKRTRKQTIPSIMKTIY